MTHEADIQQSLVKALNNEYRRLATSFEEMFEPLLKNVTEQEAIKRHDELVGICREAGNLAYKLWSQKTQMKLKMVFGRKSLFHIRSEIMQPHASMLCDHDSHEYDGRIVELCVEPALLAFGNEQGQAYNEYKIWMSATVWIGEDVSLKPISPTSTATKSTEITDLPIKEEAYPQEDAVDVRPMKRVRLSPAVPPSEATKFGTNANAKQESIRQMSAHIKTNSSSAPPSSKRDSEGNKRSTAEFSPGDAASSMNAFEEMKESAKSKPDPAGSQKNTLKKNKPVAPAPGGNPRASQKNQPGMRSHMAGQASIHEMGNFDKLLAEAGRGENTCERRLTTGGADPAQLRRKIEQASMGGHQEAKEQAKGINKA